jgi:hypothetical protein
MDLIFIETNHDKPISRKVLRQKLLRVQYLTQYTNNKACCNSDCRIYIQAKTWSFGKYITLFKCNTMEGFLASTHWLSTIVKVPHYAIKLRHKCGAETYLVIADYTSGLRGEIRTFVDGIPGTAIRNSSVIAESGCTIPAYMHDIEIVLPDKKIDPRISRGVRRWIERLITHLHADLHNDIKKSVEIVRALDNGTIDQLASDPAFEVELDMA